ncbi:MAG: holA [Chitinophagaceae bacterium]|nr:holA [Chitinophagaceae bacterium]
MSAEKILSDWKKKQFKPLYWLEGEEPYFIDLLVEYAEKQILSEAEAEFNLSVFYGKDVEWATLINACRRYPMFAEKQVVLLKEAQQMREIEKLEGYVDNPLTSTIFVVAYKEKKLDARTKFAKLVKQKGEVLTTKKLYDNQLPDWTRQMVAQKKLEISDKALLLLVDHIGNDLNRLQNEVDKLALNLDASKQITEEHIEEYIGISKEFNVFELQDAIAGKNLAKAIRIIQYFQSNPKAGPIQQVLPALFSYFSKVYSIFGMPDQSERGVQSVFYNNPFAAKTAVQASKSFGQPGMEKVLLLLHEYNLRSLGVHDAGTEDADLMKEMVVKMIA